MDLREEIQRLQELASIMQRKGDGMLGVAGAGFYQASAQYEIAAAILFAKLQKEI